MLLWNRLYQRQAEPFLLHHLNPITVAGHLNPITAAGNIPRTYQAFEMTSKCWGSWLVGYWKTPADFRIGSAMAASQAAFSSTTGVGGGMEDDKDYPNPNPDTLGSKLTLPPPSSPLLIMILCPVS